MVDSCSSQNNGNASVNLINGHEKMNINNHREQPKNNADLKAPTESNIQSPLLSSLLQAKVKESNGNQHAQHVIMGGHDSGSSQEEINVLPQLHHHLNRPQVHNADKHMLAPESVPNQSDSQSNDINKKCPISAQLLHKNYHNLDALYNLNKHHNNNSNNSNNSFGVDRLLTTTKASSTTKSILEHRLLSQSSKLESQPPVQLLAMDEGNFHPSTSALTYSPEMRKVEPLKINLLHREPIRTVIKIPPGASPTAPNSPKVTIKPLAIPKITIKSVLNPQPPTTVSPTSSSSSFTSESSADITETVKVPKLHIKHGGSNHCDPSEPQTVPKLTIRGVAPPTNNVESIPKITIKMDNHDNNFHHSVANHHNAPATSVLSKEGVKLKIKMTEPSQVPKLTIKTSDHEPHFVSSTSNTFSPAAMRVESPIPKLTIKATNSTLATSKLETVPKLTIKPIIRPEEELIHKLNIKPVFKPGEDVSTNNETIPKLTIKAVSNNSNNFEKVVPKLIVKIPPQTPDYSEHTETELSSNSSSPSPPIVHKLNIKPIPYPNETPQDAVPKILIKIPQQEHYNNQKAEKTEKPEKSDRIVIDDTPPQLQPLEVNTSSVKTMDSGQDSPRIILKINKTNKETITSEFINPAPTSTSSNASITSNFVEEKPMSITSSFNNHQTHNNKRTAKVTNDDCEQPKKLKIAKESEVIMINDDTNSDDDSQKKINENNGSRIETGQKNLLSKIQNARESLVPDPDQDEPIEAEQEIFIPNNLLLINEDNEGSSSDCVVVQVDPLNNAHSNSLSNDVDLVTPKRGRGRPKKIHTISAVQLEEEGSKTAKIRRGKIIPIKLPNQGSDEKVKERKNKKEKLEDTPENHKVSALKTSGRGSGRGRGRGRAKRTIEVIKDGKPVKITLDRDDDDDSPSFSIWNRNASGRGARKVRGRGSANRAGNHSGRKGEFMSPAANEPKDGIRRKIFFGEPSTPSMFEDESTRMSAGGDPLATPGRQFSDFGNEESQSSMLSSASNTIDGTSKKRAKLEVFDPNGVELTIDLLAEYDWPQQLPEGASKHSRDTFMIQEQIAEYLGVKSFKRKYPDLMRRPVDMEERNYLFENGLASEKMCDLGLTAVYAAEILDIICNDYPDKYEEYKRYQREKQFHLRSRLKALEPVDKSQLQKDKAIQSASNWNVNFNKDRRENRRCCMDLQSFVVQLPEAKRKTMTVPMPKPSTYPVALVPGQFAESCRKYTPEELACYPLNTVLLDHNKLDNYLATHPNPYEFSEESSSDSDSASSSGDSSSSDSDSDTDSDDDEQATKLCSVCLKSQTCNQHRQPEIFVRCSGCKNRAHPSCIEMSTKMFQRVSEYDWMCSQCKKCCKCEKAKDTNKMLFCHQCDRGYHIYCLGLRNVPEGRWHCDICTICGNCGSKNPEGHPDPSLSQQQRQELSMIANWAHMYQQNPLTKIDEHQTTLCFPCVRLSQKPTTPEKTVNIKSADTPQQLPSYK